MKNIFILILFLVFTSGVCYAQGYTPIDQDTNNVQTMLDDLEKEMNNEKPVTAPVEQTTPIKQVVAKKVEVEPKVAVASAPAPVPAPKPQVTATEAPEGDIYEYGYMQKPESKASYGKEEGATGKPGNFIISFLAQLVDYPTYSKFAGGGAVELGGQFNIFKYLSVAILSGADFRKGNLSGHDLYTIPLKASLRFRVFSWLYPFAEGGVEFVKINGISTWRPPFKLFGGGLLIRMGAADKKSEYNLYKTASITRTMLVIAFDTSRANPIDATTPDSYLLRFGLSLEF